MAGRSLLSAYYHPYRSVYYVVSTISHTMPSAPVLECPKPDWSVHLQVIGVFKPHCLRTGKQQKKGSKGPPTKSPLKMLNSWATKKNWHREVSQIYLSAGLRLTHRKGPKCQPLPATVLWKTDVELMSRKSLHDFPSGTLHLLQLKLHLQCFLFYSICLKQCTNMRRKAEWNKSAAGPN